jgi:hypothetical protein
MTSKKAKEGAELLAGIDAAGLAPPRKPLDRAAATLPSAVAAKDGASKKATQGAELLAAIEKSTPTRKPED